MQVRRCTKCMEELKEGVRLCPHCGYEQDSTAQPSNALNRNTILHGRYYIGNVIGQGGFGITYVGLDLVLDMKVAVKEYFPTGSVSRINSYSNEIQWDFTGSGRESWSDGIDRFLREARKMAKLDSVPAIVRVRDAFPENQTAYIVMDFVKGDTLKNYLLGHGVLRCEECMALLSPILDSLVVIHDRGFIHRDISPDNIMLQPDGTARLLDMGAAVDVKNSKGRASMLVIKRNFSAPEQYMESETLGSWTDVYAMGATIYYCLTGKVVPEALERGVRNTPLYYDPDLNIPRHVTIALNDALKLQAGCRIRDMREFKRRLSGPEEPAGQKDDGAEVEIAPEQDQIHRTGRRGKRNALIAVGALCVLCVLAVLFYAFRDSGSAAGSEVESTAVAEAGQTNVPAGQRADDGGAPEEKTVEEPTAAQNEQETAGASKYVDVDEAELIYQETKEGNGIMLREYIGKDSYIRLPDEVEGLPVLELGVFFFSQHETLEGVVLPEKVEYLGWFTLAKCTNLKEVELPKDLETIGENSFSECPGLRRIELPEGLKSIQDQVFEGSGLEEITIPSSVEFLGVGSAILQIPQVKIAEGNQRFKMRDGLIYKDGNELAAVPQWIEGKFVISPEINAIGGNAFYRTSLTEVEIPGSVRVVKPKAFSEGHRLETVKLGEGVEELGYHCFAGCESLREIMIPRSVRTIDFNAFKGCVNLKTVTVSKDCQIDEDAFDPGVEINYYD